MELVVADVITGVNLKTRPSTVLTDGYSSRGNE